MKVSIIGYGNMGTSLAHALVRAGHTVTLTGNSLEKATAAAEKTGSRALPASQAAQDAEVVIAATHYGTQVSALKSLGNLAGKVVVDISNPLKPDMSGLQIGHSTSAAEEVAKQFPEAKVVKAFNTVFAQVLQAGPQFKNGKAPIFYAGDDEAAKTKVKNLIESLGFEATDAGPLAHARYLEPMAMLNIWFGYMAQKGTGITPAWISRA